MYTIAFVYKVLDVISRHHKVDDIKAKYKALKEKDGTLKKEDVFVPLSKLKDSFEKKKDSHNSVPRIYSEPIMRTLRDKNIIVLEGIESEGGKEIRYVVIKTPKGRKYKYLALFQVRKFSSEAEKVVHDTFKQVGSVIKIKEFKLLKTNDVFNKVKELMA